MAGGVQELGFGFGCDGHLFVAGISLVDFASVSVHVLPSLLVVVD